MARAMAESDRYGRPCHSKPSASTVTVCSVPCHSRTSRVPTIGFMSDDHVRNPSSYYHVPVYLEMLDTYHARCSSILANGRDSAVRRRAVEAGLSPSETRALIDRLENTFLAFQGHHDAARRAAIRASAVHRHLLGYEGRVNPGPNGVEFRDRAAQAEYDRILAQLAQDQETLARLDQERRDALQAVLGDLGL